MNWLQKVVWGVFSSYLVEHFLGNGKKEITFVKKEKHEEVGKDDHHARKCEMRENEWSVVFSRQEALKALVYMI